MLLLILPHLNRKIDSVHEGVGVGKTVDNRPPTSCDVFDVETEEKMQGNDRVPFGEGAHYLLKVPLAVFIKCCRVNLRFERVDFALPCLYRMFMKR